MGNDTNRVTASSLILEEETQRNREVRDEFRSRWILGVS